MFIKKSVYIHQLSLCQNNFYWFLLLHITLTSLLFLWSPKILKSLFWFFGSNFRLYCGDNVYIVFTLYSFLLLILCYLYDDIWTVVGRKDGTFFCSFTDKSIRCQRMKYSFQYSVLTWVFTDELSYLGQSKLVLFTPSNCMIIWSDRWKSVHLSCSSFLSVR